LPRIRGILIKWAALSVVLIGVLAPGNAQAGTMVLYSCHTPSGRIVGTAGWNFWAENAMPLPRSGNTCATGRNGTLALEVGRASGGHPDYERRIGWIFYPAANTSVGAFTAYVCGVAYTHFAGADIRWTAPIGVKAGRECTPLCRLKMHPFVLDLREIQGRRSVVRA
jgi:hypothetical protein